MSLTDSLITWLQRDYKV